MWFKEFNLITYTERIGDVMQLIFLNYNIFVLIFRQPGFNILQVWAACWLVHYIL